MTAKQPSLIFQFRRYKAITWLGGLVLVACSINITDNTEIPQTGHQKVKVLNLEAEIIENLVNEVSIKGSIGVSVGKSINEIATVYGQILQLNPNLNLIEIKNRVIRNFVFGTKVVYIDAHNSEIPLCNNKILNLYPSPSDLQKISFKVSSEYTYSPKTPYCLANLHFSLPPGFNLTVKKNGVLFAQGKTTFQEIKEKIKRLDPRDKVRLAIGHLRNMDAGNRKKSLHKLIDLMPNAKSKRLLIIKAVPAEVVYSMEDFYLALTNFPSLEDPNYKDSLVHLLSHSIGKIETFQITGLIQNLGGYQQIDILNVLLYPNLKVIRFPRFDHVYQFLKSFTYEVKRLSVIERTLQVFDYSRFNEKQIQLILNLFPSPSGREEAQNLLPIYN